MTKENLSRMDSSELDSKMSNEEEAGESYFVVVFTANEQRIRRFLRTLLPNQSDLDDVAQNVAIRLWQRFPNYDIDRPFLPWALGVATNVVSEYRRNVKRQPMLFSPEVVEQMREQFLESELIKRSQVEIDDYLKLCLERLASRSREIVHRRYIDGSSVETIASTMEMTIDAIYKQLARSYQRLADCLRHQISSRKSTES
ncbi:sigma-70 family RNA polymerase sigma factor [Gimesia aquarii]|uniref:ECF RNA polymerase sigma factor SigD n=1 Tax=Gimesia aquarii TaxID=2527964 RepID=A0A517W0Y3_9PLAN|nr:sigma-70 family RNA polymerase sigma factor [Gimesia aquarii]QDT98913.1 ECF RNA polymerase sigma factor SigD [Gimesia aquarii]